MQFATALFALALALTAVADPILQAPVDTPVLIQTELVNTLSAPCLQAQGNYDGAPVVLATCGNFHGAEKEWKVVEGGAVEASGSPGPVTQIRLFGDKCLDVPNGNNNNGVKLQIWTCYDGNPNQLWQVNSDETINWASHTKCLDLTNGDLLDPVVPAQIWECATAGKINFNQLWNAIPPR